MSWTGTAAPDVQPPGTRAGSCNVRRRPVADVLRAVEWELADLGRCAVAQQEGLAPLLRLTSGDHEAIRGIQDLDLLSQRLNGLAEFLGALALLLPDGCDCDADAAAAVLTLSDQKRRLGSASDASPTPDAAAGTLELFGITDGPSGERG